MRSTLFLFLFCCLISHADSSFKPILTPEKVAKATDCHDFSGVQSGVCTNDITQKKCAIQFKIVQTKCESLSIETGKIDNACQLPMFNLLKQDRFQLGYNARNSKIGEFPKNDPDGIRRTKYSTVLWKSGHDSGEYDPNLDGPAKAFLINETESVFNPAATPAERLHGRSATASFYMGDGGLKFRYSYEKAKDGVEDWKGRKNLSLSCAFQEKKPAEQFVPEQGVIPNH